MSSAKSIGWIAVAIVLPPVALFAAYIGLLFAGYEIPEPELSAVGTMSLLAVSHQKTGAERRQAPLED